MLRIKLFVGIWLVLICSAVSLSAQQAALAAANAVVPPVIKFGGVLTDARSKPMSGTVGVTFSLYKESQGGAPLWLETQNVTLDKAGHYSVMLGSSTSQGVPSDVFASGEARWLGVQAQGETEQPRTLLMSVPYALKAADAETFGGKPLSAFQLALPRSNTGTTPGAQRTRSAAEQPNEIICSSLTACKTGFIPLFSSNGGSAKVSGSIMRQSGASVTVAGSATVTSTASSPALVGRSSGTNAVSDGVEGVTSSGTASGVAGINNGGGVGVYGTGAPGVYGTSYNGSGVSGASTNGYGVAGNGVTGLYGSGINYGVYASAGPYGVLGNATGSNGFGVYGSGNAYGVYGTSGSAGGSGVGALNTSTGDALFTYNQSGGWAAFFDGDVDVDGNLSKAGGSFKIDDPLDPANKYLYHSFVESPDMMNIYNGNATTDEQGSAVVQLPEWFETLNRDFRYQLTVIGQFSQAFVASKVANHQFAIKTDKPNVEVSWQVTGIRQDAWANAHRIPVEVLKAERDRGLYLHPELFGAPAEKNIGLARHPMIQKLLKEATAK
jgi:hypothetical protein